MELPKANKRGWETPCFFFGIEGIHELRTKLCADCPYESIEVGNGQVFESNLEQKVVVDREDLDRVKVVRPRGPGGKLAMGFSIGVRVIKGRDNSLGDGCLKLLRSGLSEVRKGLAVV